MIYYIKLMLETLNFTRFIEREQQCKQNSNKWDFIDKIHATLNQDVDVANPFDLVALVSAAYTSLRQP